MMLPLEILLYALQIVSWFFLAAPVLLKAERQRSLARNPAWVAAEPGFLARHGQITMRPSHACGALLLLLLLAGAVLSSRLLLFLAHGPVFAVAAVALLLAHDARERKLRAEIPAEPVRRASLKPRTLLGFLPAWAYAAVALPALAALAVNAWGWLSGAMLPARAAGNAAFLALFALGFALALRYILGRPAYRVSEATDASGRSLELALVLGVAAFLAVVNLYHSLGSLGPDPLFDLPPTLLHARIEGGPWAWNAFFTRAEYRWVEIGAAVFIALFGPWAASSRFHRRLLEVDIRRVAASNEV